MEETVLQTLLNNDEYFNKTLSHLRSDFFVVPENNVIFNTIYNYVTDYNTKPNLREIAVIVSESNKLNRTVKAAALEKFKELSKEQNIANIDFLIDKTESWVQKLKLTSAVFTAADIIQADEPFEPIVDMVDEALNVCFDTSIGLDFGDKKEDRLEYYKNKNIASSTGISTLDEALGGGIRPGSLFGLIGPTHSGKTAGKIFLGSSLLLAKENVLFITLEMPELEIAKRFDANLLGVNISELAEIPNDILRDKMDKLNPNIGKLVIKEYGAGTLDSLTIKSLLNELKTKTDFIPDAIIVDYLGLMVSHRASPQANAYDTLGKVAEDLHAISKETYDSKGNKGIKVITSSQANRSAIGNLDAGMENISDSLRISMTLDCGIFLLKTDAMAEQNQQIWKIVKNRYTGDMASLLLETNFNRMMYKPFDGESSVADNIVNEMEIPSIDTGLELGSFDFA